MIVVDTGPLVAAFDPSDSDHAAWKQVLAEFGEEALTTIPVLTEAFHFLSRRPRQALGLMELVRYGPLTVSRLGDRDLGPLLRTHAPVRRHTDGLRGRIARHRAGGVPGLTGCSRWTSGTSPRTA